MRTGSVAKGALAAISLVFAGISAHALDLGIEAAASNLQLPWTPVSPLSGSPFPNSNYFWGGEAWLTAPLGEDASIRLSYDRDPVLRNTAIAAVQFERGIARISVGPLIGFLNSDSVPISAGISAAVRLQWPGVAYVSMRSDGGTAISILQASVDPQARTELAAGFYVPNAIVSGLISAKRFNELDASGNLVTDSLTRYAMTIDVFKKNVPYTAMLSLGYELRSKHYDGATPADAVTDTLGAVVMGIDATAQLGHAVTLLGGISTGAYVFGLDALKGRGPDNSTFLFSASLGASVDTSAIKILPKTPAEKAQKPKVEAPKAEEPPAAKPPAKAPEKESALKSKPTIAAGVGFHYDSYPLTGTIADIAIVIFNLRGGLWGDFMFPLGGNLALGPEAGAYYLATTTGPSTSFFDIPLNAKIEYSLGKIKFDGFAGLFTTITQTAMSGSTTPTIGFGVDPGLRILLGGFFLEGSYVVGLSNLQNFPRYGMGYTLKILK